METVTEQLEVAADNLETLPRSGEVYHGQLNHSYYQAQLKVGAAILRLEWLKMAAAEYDAVMQNPNITREDFKAANLKFRRVFKEVLGEPVPKLGGDRT